MKKSSLCAFAVLAFAGSATVASASTVYFSSGIRDTNFNGGEFISNLSNGNSYRSFCLEFNETIGLGSNVTYSYEITTAGARNGGVSGGNPDPVSSAAASIFVSWLNGSIANNVANATAVQQAIWAIEGEVAAGSLSGFAATLYSNAIGSFSTTDNAPLDNPMFRNIRVLNPFRVNADGSITHFQSQIILIPLPTASGLALAGLALVGGIRRRK